MIQLTEKLALDADENQFIVGEPRMGGKAQRFILRNPSYHVTLEAALAHALKSCLRQGVAEGSITTLHDYLTRERDLIASFRALIKGAAT